MVGGVGGVGGGGGHALGGGEEDSLSDEEEILYLKDWNFAKEFPVSGPRPLVLKYLTVGTKIPNSLLLPAGIRAVCLAAVV
jgi:hypothetical protein